MRWMNDSKVQYKVKASPAQALWAPGGSGSQISIQSAHEGGKAVSSMHRPPLSRQEIFLVLTSVTRLSRPQGNSAAGRDLSMKNSNNTIGDRTCDLPPCRAVHFLLWNEEKYGTFWVEKMVFDFCLKGNITQVLNDKNAPYSPVVRGFKIWRWNAG
jgi:hypothetical protein